MSWDLASLKKDWLLGAECSYTDKEIIKGFSTVDKFLGKNFIESHWNDQRGLVVVIQVVNLGLNLEWIGNIKGAENLLKKLSNKQTYRIAASELDVGAFFAKKNLLSEVYPHAPEAGNELDFKLSKNGEIIYVEVTSPETSVANKYLSHLANKLSKIAKVLPNTRLEVYLYDFLDNGNLQNLYKKCYQLIKAVKVGFGYREHGKYAIMLSRAEEGGMSKLTKKKKVDEPVFFATNLSQKAGIKNFVTVKVPFADKRAEEVLARKYHQLVAGYPNIVVIDVTRIPNGIKNWPVIIKRRFQPKINRKISAVLLWSSILSPAEGVKTSRYWIKNQYANIKLCREFSVGSDLPI